MNEQELRTIVRAAIARHAGIAGAVTSHAPARGVPADASSLDWRGHSSHMRYASLVNVSEACLIEPDVPCNHCNYCKSHGH